MNYSNCYACKKELDNEICLFDNNAYHKYCCGFCKHTWTPPAKIQRRPTLITKEVTPPPQIIKARSPSPPPVKLVKAKSNPRKLSFAQITSFESSDNFMIKCFTCNKPINGQKFLSSKIGQFNCQQCHALNGPKCHMCNKLFDEAEIVYKDDEKNKCCESCIQIYHENKSKEIVQIRRSSLIQNKTIKKNSNNTATSRLKTKVTAVMGFKNINKISYKDAFKLDKSIEETIAKICYSCCQTIDLSNGKILAYKGNDYHEKCFICMKCNKSIAGKLFYEQNDQLVCEDCRLVPKCIACKNIFNDLQRIYTTNGSNSNTYCEQCYEMNFSNSCSKCMERIGLDQTSVIYDDRFFHSDCFICKKCLTKLNPDEKVFKGNNSLDLFCISCSVTG